MPLRPDGAQSIAFQVIVGEVAAVHRHAPFFRSAFAFFNRVFAAHRLALAAAALSEQLHPHHFVMPLTVPLPAPPASCCT